MQKLIFVYNADSGYFNMITDIAHKIFAPATYPCSLCDLTYGIFKIRPEWDDFIKSTPVPLDFLHKDEFHKMYPDWQKLPLPTVLSAGQNGLTEVLTAADLEQVKSIAALKQAIEAQIIKN